jgi:protein adenylyltransferase
VKQSDKYQLIEFKKLSLGNSYLELPEEFYQVINPTPVKAPNLLLFNQSVASDLGFCQDDISKEFVAAYLSGNQPFKGSQPLALAYAGHQFGYFVPQLGDGRAHILGDIVDKKGDKFDLQLKGSGRTQFSRQGDGRAPLAATIREYIVSEFMHAAGIPTTRSLSVVASGESLNRQDIVPGGILTRIAKSHIRVGSFEYFAAKRQNEMVKLLADFSIDRHYAHIKDKKDKYQLFFAQVIALQAKLVAKWQCIGFIHGVMNTDNMTISGETIDYGPCAFIDRYNPNQVYSSIDTYGRYAFANQAPIAKWNLARFAQTLLPLFDDDIKNAVNIATNLLDSFDDLYGGYWLNGMQEKLGLTIPQPNDSDLINQLLDLLAQANVDYTSFFRTLIDILDGKKIASLTSNEAIQAKLNDWLLQWQSRLESEKELKREQIALMKRVNPIFIPRNYLIEPALTEAVNGDMAKVNQLFDAVSKPFTPNDALSHLAKVPSSMECQYQTFCGT